MSKVLATCFATVNDIPGMELRIEILKDEPVKKVSVNDTIYDVDYNLGGDAIHSIIMNHKSHGIQISSVGDSIYEAKNKGDYFQVRVIDELKELCLSKTSSKTAGRQVTQAQMPGMIQKIYVKVGDRVKAGDPLCVLVVMKMENGICMSIDRVVREVYVNETDKVSVGDKVLAIEWVVSGL